MRLGLNAKSASARCQATENGLLKAFGILLFSLLLLLAACSGGASQPLPAPAPTVPPPSPVSITPNHSTVSQIQTLPAWDSCTLCAGENGNGPLTDYSLQQFVQTPSLSGSAAKYFVGGTPWGAALWWKAVGGDDSVRNFVYELDFYFENPGVSQAVEFDVNQNAGGFRYVFATECDLGNTHTWRVADNTGHWISSGVSCPTPRAKSWNHLTWEFQRTDGVLNYVAVTLNGVRSKVDRSFPANAQADAYRYFDVAFQMDLDGVPDNYSVWLDNISLTYW